MSSNQALILVSDAKYFARVHWLFLVLILCVCLSFWTSWQSFYSTWSSQDFSYGWLIAPISIWLVWRRKNRLRALAVSRWSIGAILVVAASIVWAAGFVTATPSVLQSGAVFALIATILFYVGPTVAKEIWFPIFFLGFMLPLGSGLTPTLTGWTADFVEFAVRAIGVPVYREAADFILPTGRWSVIAACSGLRYLLSATILAALFAHLNFKHPLKGAVFCITVVLASIVMNWFRAAITVYLGHLTNMRFGPGEEHVWLGWILFGIVMYAICRFASRWVDTESLDSVSQPLIEPTHVSAAPSLKNQFFLGLIVLICGGVFMLSFDKNLVKPKVDVGVKLAEQIGGEAVSKVAYEVPLKGYQETIKRRIGGSVDADVVLAYFANQPSTNSMISLVNSIIPDEENTQWRLIDLRRVAIESKSPNENQAVGLETPFSVNLQVVRNGNKRLRVAYWYTIGGKHTTGGYLGKVLTLRSLVGGKGDHSVLSMVILDHSERGDVSLSAQEQTLLAKIATAAMMVTR